MDGDLNAATSLCNDSMARVAICNGSLLELEMI